MKILLLAFLFVVAGCALTGQQETGRQKPQPEKADAQQYADRETSEKLRTICIPDEKLSGSPKQIVKQLNKLARRYDEPAHQGVPIRFDSAVDNENCDMTISEKGEPLANWIQDVCESCGSKYCVTGSEVLIELLPISEKQTSNLESSLTNGMVEICRQFRANRGRDRYELGKKLLELLPRSPVTWHDPGYELFSYDYEHPNNKLYKRDVLILLGEPDRNQNNQTFYYTVKQGHDKWELEVEFGKHDYVENSILIGY